MPEPVIAGMELPDAELREFLGELIQGVRATPASASMRGRLGMAYEANGFPDAAIATYLQAESLHPKDFRWPYFAALLLAKKGLHEDALAALRRAMAIDADYAPAWLWQGTWLLTMDRQSDALLAFDQAHRLGAGSEADFGRAAVSMAQGKHAQAVALLEPFARESTHPHVHRTLGRALMALGRLDDARLATARGREPMPFGWTDARTVQTASYARGYASFAIAQSLSSEGSTDQALEIFKRLQGRHPEEDCGREQNFFFACNLLNSSSIAHGRAGRIRYAIELAERGIAINPNFMPFYLAIADHHRQLRDFDSALRYIEQGLALHPRNGHAHAQKGRYLFGLGRYRQAKEALLSALRFAPEKPITLFYLGFVEVELEDWGSAARRFQRVVQIDPDFALGHLYLARSLGEGGRIDEAGRALAVARERGADADEIRTTQRRLRQLAAQDDATLPPRRDWADAKLPAPAMRN